VNILVVGVSHRTADVGLLERVTLQPGELTDLLGRLLGQPYVREAMVVSTCNRVEVYAVVASFHGGLSDVGTVLAERAGIAVSALADRLYAHYGTDAVRHAYRVAAGLDSMVVGESQILGQFRDAYAAAAEHGATGRMLHELAQQALRVGKRVHAETGIDRAGQSVVSAALDLGLGDEPAAGKRALVLGAGAMGALALATLHRRGVTELLIANRTTAKAVHLAAAYGATAAPIADLPALLTEVDILVSATASAGRVVTRVPPRAAPLLILDLAVPHDVDPSVAGHPAVTLIDIERLRRAGRAGVAGAAGTAATVAATADVALAEDIVAAEVEAFVAWHRESDVAPTVAALRSRAEDLVTAELRRLAARTAGLTDEQRAEVAKSMHRIVQRLLHEPTVRIRQRASEPGGEAYANLLRDLFDLPEPLDVPGALEAGPEGT
jgi:glutamyl-tRNA reductase